MLIVGQNSCVSIEEADSYLEDRGNATNWFALADTGMPGSSSKSSYLVTAFRTLVQVVGSSINATSTDVNVKQAQIEQALYQSKHLLFVDNREGPLNTGLKETEVLSKKEKYEGGISYIPPRILSMLSQYTSVGGGFVDATINMGEFCE